MALIKYGGGVIQMSGSIAGNTFARNRYGNYARAKTKPVNPNTIAQVAVRSAVTFLVDRWASTLTEAQRTAWKTYADAVNMVNRLGETVQLSGFNHYIRSNTTLQVQSKTLVDAGPTTLSLPEKDSTFAATASAATQLISVTFDDTMEFLDEDDAYMFVYQGQPQKATRNFFAGPWKYGTSIDGDSVTPLTSPQTFTAPFTLVEGQKSWLYARIQRADGRISEKFFCSFTCAA